MGRGVIGAFPAVASVPVSVSPTAFHGYATHAFTSSGGLSLVAGSWVELAASVSGRLLLSQVGAVAWCDYSGTADPGASWRMVAEFGVGGSGSEVVVACAVAGGVFDGSSSDLPSSAAGNVPVFPLVDVPAGSRLALRVTMQVRLVTGRSVTAGCDGSVFLVDPLDVV